MKYNGVFITFVFSSTHFYGRTGFKSAWGLENILNKKFLIRGYKSYYEWSSFNHEFYTQSDWNYYNEGKSLDPFWVND